MIIDYWKKEKKTIKRKEKNFKCRIFGKVDKKCFICYIFSSRAHYLNIHIFKSFVWGIFAILQ